MEDRKKNNQSISQKADQLIRNYRVYWKSDKEEVLDTLFKKIEEQEKAVQKSQRRISWFRVAAASVAATAAVLLAFWFFTASVILTSPEGQTLTSRLPDASRVILHDGSTLKYSKFVWNRKVNLSGEAYFEVENGTGFRVQTANGEVEVLGTRFLVSERENRFSVQCFQGRVKAGFQNETAELEPGTQFTAGNETAVKENFSNEKNYPAFARFQKNFSGVAISQVTKEIETFFGVEIELDVDAGKKFTGTVQSGNLENVLQIVCEPLQLKYSIEDEYRILIFKERN
jgi:transmembrane sensor